MIDIKFFFLSNIILLLFLSFYMIILYIRDPKNRAIQFITYFTVFFFFAFVLFVLRNQISDFLSIVVANTLFAIAILFLYIAIKVSLNLDSKWHLRYWIPIIIFFVGFFIFTHLSFNFSSRLYIYCIFLIIYCIHFAWLFRLHKSEKFKLFDTLSSIFFLLGVVVFLLVIVFSNIESFSNYYFANINFALYLPNIFYFILNLWAVMLIKYRIKN